MLVWDYIRTTPENKETLMRCISFSFLRYTSVKTCYVSSFVNLSYSARYSRKCNFAMQIPEDSTAPQLPPSADPEGSF